MDLSASRRNRDQHALLAGRARVAGGGGQSHGLRAGPTAIRWDAAAALSGPYPCGARTVARLALALARIELGGAFRLTTRGARQDIRGLSSRSRNWSVPLLSRPTPGEPDGATMRDPPETQQRTSNHERVSGALQWPKQPARRDAKHAGGSLKSPTIRLTNRALLTVVPAPQKPDLNGASTGGDQTFAHTLEPERGMH